MSQVKFKRPRIWVFMVLAAASAVAWAGGGMKGHASGDVVDTAIGAGRFTTLVKAVKAADLVETLKGEGPFTVFAPTDEAFARLPAGTMDALLADRERLAAVLTYHVVPGRLTAAEVTARSSLDTVNGQSLPVSVNGGAVHIGSARLIQADVPARNGVIHVIDTVVLPD